MHSHLRTAWKPLDSAAAGVAYGAILVLSMLMALEETRAAPFRPAIILFGSVLAVSLAKAFSELLGHSIHTHERILTRRALGAAWQSSRPTLAMANLPTAVVLAAGLGWMDFALAVAVAQAFCIIVLAVLGARMGWSIRPRSCLPLAGAVSAGGIGSALAVLKYAVH